MMNEFWYRIETLLIRINFYLSPRSSGDRAPPSGGGGAGSIPVGGTVIYPSSFAHICRNLSADILVIVSDPRENSHLSDRIRCLFREITFTQGLIPTKYL